MIVRSIYRGRTYCGYYMDWVWEMSRVEDWLKICLIFVLCGMAGALACVIIGKSVLLGFFIGLIGGATALGLVGVGVWLAYLGLIKWLSGGL